MVSKSASPSTFSIMHFIKQISKLLLYQQLCLCTTYIIIIASMINSNAELLNDLNTLMKGIKKREEIHLLLLDYVKKVIVNKDDCSMFLEEEIHAHRLFVADLSTRDLKVREEEDLLRGKYEGRFRLEEGDLKLVARLSLRILEICQASYEKLKQYFNFFEEIHQNFHQTITHIIQSERIQLKELVGLFLNYSRGKYDEDLGSLNTMIEMIERGDRDQVATVTQERQEKRQRQIQAKKAEQQKKKKELMMEARKEKQKLTDRLSKMKEQARQIQKIKKKKSRFVDRVFTKLYGVLDPIRQEVMDDMVYTCKPDLHFKKLYTQIFERNQCNYNQISHFYSKADDFKQKIRLFKQRMLVAPSPPRKSARGMRAFSNSINPLQDIRLEIPIYGSTDCLTTSVLQSKYRQSALSTDRPMESQDDLEILSASNGNNERRSAQNISSRKQEKYFPSHFLASPHGKLPQIKPFTDRKLQNDRYSSMANKSRRFSDPKGSEAANTSSLKIQSRVMQVPLIHLNMVEKFEFKVHEQQPKKQKLPKSFEYTFHFRKRENRFLQTRANFML